MRLQATLAHDSFDDNRSKCDKYTGRIADSAVRLQQTREENHRVQTKSVILSSIFLSFSLVLAIPAQAFDMGNMMNPSKWMGNKSRDRDRYDDDYDDYGPPPGYGYGGPGYGYGGPGYGGYGGPGYGGYGGPGYGGYGGPGYGGPGYGYGAPGYGYGGAPATGAPQGYNSGSSGEGSSSRGGSYSGPSYGGNYTGPSDYGPGITSDDQEEINRLKQRIQRLEQGQGSPRKQQSGNVW